MPRKQDPQKKRKRGGQPGNANALKTGFYARCFRDVDISDLQTHQFKGLEGEITLIRVFIRRLLEDIEKADSIKERLSILRALSTASSSITHLLKVDHDIFGDFYERLEEINRIGAEISAEEHKNPLLPTASSSPPQPEKEDGIVYQVDDKE